MKPDLLQNLTIIRLEGDDFCSVNDQVVVEKVFKLTINDADPLAVSLSPQYLEEFLVGFLFSAGFIHGLKDIINREIGPDYLKARLRLQNGGRPTLPTGCTGSPLPEVDLDRPPLLPAPVPPAAILLPAFARFLASGELFQASGGTHAAALVQHAELLCYAEDIGRHNAFDKVVGMALLRGLDFSRLQLFSSGRISAEIVRKALRAGIRVLVSHSAATSLAVELARRSNLTLLGFTRGRRFNVYSGQA